MKKQQSRFQLWVKLVFGLDDAADKALNGDS
jgi:hypothetical protein